MTANNRAAYQSESILAEGFRLSNDTWTSHLNCNQLVLGPSGSGKTRNFLKPNLLQANASYVVLDTKGLLYREVGPVLARHGYRVEMLDFADMRGTIGYDPLDHIRRADDTGKPNQEDILSVAKAICAVENRDEPFWDYAAANYLAAYIAYVLELNPRELQSFDKVVDLFEMTSDNASMDEKFGSLERVMHDSYAARIYQRTKKTMEAEKMHASIMGIIAEKLMCLGSDRVRKLYRNPNKIDIASLGHERMALFVSLSDVDYGMTPLTNLFVTHMIQGLVREADDCPGGMLPVPVRLFLDDFSNLNIPNFDKTLSVVRSREIWITILCQSVSQLQALYGEAAADTIMANCDAQLVLAFQDNATSQAYAPVASRTVDALRATPLDQSWLFVRGERPRLVTKFDPATHECYAECAGAAGEPTR